MKITTNVAKTEDQVKMINDIVIDHLGQEIKPTTSLDQDKSVEEIISSWVKWLDAVPEEERLSTKVLTTNLGRVILRHNNLTGNIKIQVSKPE